MHLKYLLPVAAIICFASYAQEEKETAVSVLNDLVDCTALINDQLASVKDRETAEAATAEIKKLGPKYAALVKKLESFPPPATPEEEKAVKDLTEKGQKLYSVFDSNMKRLLNSGLISMDFALALKTMSTGEEKTDAAPSK